jgi:hypothetical protein
VEILTARLRVPGKGWNSYGDTDWWTITLYEDEDFATAVRSFRFRLDVHDGRYKNAEQMASAFASEGRDTNMVHGATLRAFKDYVYVWMDVTGLPAELFIKITEDPTAIGAIGEEKIMSRDTVQDPVHTFDTMLDIIGDFI